MIELDLDGTFTYLSPQVYDTFTNNREELFCYNYWILKIGI